jgi:Multicopper oxidase
MTARYLQRSARSRTSVSQPSRETGALTRPAATGRSTDLDSIQTVLMPNRCWGTTEKWVFTNPTGQPHTVHIHDVSQQCISRNGAACYSYETMKETWYLAPGEVLEVKLKFTDHVGMYMLHCHMVEHEDDGMMTQFEVVRANPTPRPRPTPRSRPTP